MDSSDRITRLSNMLYWASTVLACALPCIVIMAIARGWFDPALLPKQFPALPDGIKISVAQGVIMAVIGVVSVWPMMAALLAMRDLFARYRRGEILTDACASDILRIGRALVLVATTTVVVPMLQLLVLSWGSKQGRILSIGINDSTLGFLVSGCLLYTIGWVMREAARAAAENAEFI